MPRPVSKQSSCHPDFTAPDFVVAGAAKAGTTALWHWLRSHPYAFVPSIKEPSHFAYPRRRASPASGPFDPDYVRGIATTPEAYAALYAKAGGRRTGDVSPVYLTDPEVPARIAALRPDARIVILLRDPVARAFSQYLHHRRDSLESLSFEDALDAESRRLKAGWSWGHAYRRNGHYLPQVEAWLVAFPRSQILILTHESMKASPEATWQRICDHIGLPSRPLGSNPSVNATSGLVSVSGRPWLCRRLRHPGLIQARLKGFFPPSVRHALRIAIEGAPRPLPPLQPRTRDFLLSAYVPERAKLARLTGLDLGSWASAPYPNG